MRGYLTVAFALALLAGCHRQEVPPAEARPKLTVAAAANLSQLFAELGPEFTRAHAIDMAFSYGATAQLTRQIERGAPFDLFASADTQHVDQLIEHGKANRASRAVFAYGRLAIWSPKQPITSAKDLARPNIKFISIANPVIAPYGKAALEALTKLNLMPTVKEKLVYAGNIAMAKQLAATGNADATLTAYSLLTGEGGTILPLDQKLHSPLEQAVVILNSAGTVTAAEQFRSFLLGPAGRAALSRHGYSLP